MGRSEKARRLVIGGFKDRFGVVEPSEDADLHFEYRSVPMQVCFDETKHGEPDMTIEVAECPSPDRMACWAYRIIMPWWQDPWSDDDRTEFWLATDSTLATLTDDALELQRLTAEAHQSVAEFLESIRVGYLVDERGSYGLDWDSVLLTFELYRNPGKTYLAVSTHWGRKGFVIGMTKQHLPIPFDGEDLLECMDSVTRTRRTEAEKVRRWLE